MMMSSLWPSNRREADLRPWRISGSECETTRSGATPWRTAGPPLAVLYVLEHHLGQQARPPRPPRGAAMSSLSAAALPRSVAASSTSSPR